MNLSLALKCLAFVATWVVMVALSWAVVVGVGTVVVLAVTS